MKKYLFMVMVAVMMLSGSITVNAQVAQNGKERTHLTEDQMIQKRTEKMVQTLMLDDATSAKFIPVYSQYLKEKMDCRVIKPKHMGMDVNAKTDAIEVNDLRSSSDNCSIHSSFPVFLSDRTEETVFLLFLS